MSVAALDEEIAELDAQIEKAQSEATALGKRARQYADLSAKLGERALEADAQHEAELAAAAAAPSESQEPPATHANGAEQSGDSSSVTIRDASQDEALTAVEDQTLECLTYVLPKFRAKFVLKADKTTHQIIAVSPSPPFELRGFVLWKEEASRRSRDVVLQLVCAEKESVQLVRRLLDEVVKRLAVGEGELKVEVNPREKGSIQYWKDLGFTGADPVLSRPYTKCEEPF